MMVELKCKICQAIYFNKHKSKCFDTYREQTTQQTNLVKNVSVKANPNENDHDHDGHGSHGDQESESDHHLPNNIFCSSELKSTIVKQQGKTEEYKSKRNEKA